MARRAGGGSWPAALVRGGGFLALWLVLAGVHLGDLPAAACAAAAATAASLILLPPRGHTGSLRGLAGLMLRFPRQSLVAGIDVAWRALSPRPALRPGFVTCVPGLPEGAAREAFLAYASLLPGTLPAGANADGTLLVHCLDTSQPAAAQLAEEEALFRRALGWRGHDV